MAIRQSEGIYKNYNIKIHHQPITGDNAKVFFSVWKNSEPIFSLWEQISGISMRGMTREEALDLLRRKGLARIKKMIDSENFKKGEEYSHWEGK